MLRASLKGPEAAPHPEKPDTGVHTHWPSLVGLRDSSLWEPGGSVICGGEKPLSELSIHTSTKKPSQPRPLHPAESMPPPGGSNSALVSSARFFLSLLHS